VKINIKLTILLACISLFYGITNYIWISRVAPQFPVSIAAPHYRAMRYVNKNMADAVSSQEGFNYKKLAFVFGMGEGYPLLVPVIFSVWTALLGRGPMRAVELNIVYIVIALIGVYLIAKKTSDEKSALLSVLFISLYPAIYGLSRMFILEFGEMAFLCVSIALLVHTEYFRIRKYSVLFGIISGVGMLTQEPFITFLIGPLLYVVAMAFVSGLKEGRGGALVSRFTNICISMVLLLAISGNYYLLNKGYASMVAKYFHEVLPAPATFYIADLILNEINIVFFVLLLIGGIFFFKNKDIKMKPMFLLWFLIPAITYTVMPHWKTGRYAVPYLPALGIITGAGLLSLPNKYVRKILVISGVLLGIVFYVDLSFTNYTQKIIGKLNINHRAQKLCTVPQKDNEFEYFLKHIALPVHHEQGDKAVIFFMPFVGLGSTSELWDLNLWSYGYDDKISIRQWGYFKGEYITFLERLFKAMDESDIVISTFELQGKQSFEKLVELNMKTALSESMYLDKWDSLIEYKSRYRKNAKMFEAAGKKEDLYFYKKRK